MHVSQDNIYYNLYNLSCTDNAHYCVLCKNTPREWGKEAEQIFVYVRFANKTFKTFNFYLLI